MDKALDFERLSTSTLELSRDCRFESGQRCNTSLAGLFMSRQTSNTGDELRVADCVSEPSDISRLRGIVYIFDQQAVKGG